MCDQMFVFLSLLPHFHLYLYKGQNREALSSGIKGSAFCHLLQRKKTSGTLKKEDRDVQMH